MSLLLLRQLLQRPEPADLFRRVDDDFWLWLHTEGLRRSRILRGILPELPDEAVQLRFTGKAGNETLLDGFRNYQAFKRAAERTLGPLRRLRVLDFGCGWGRITRFFVRDVPRENLFGIDVEREVLEFCRQSNRWVQFTLGPTSPPTHFADSSFDFIYAFSVFSHFSEEMHWRWLEEFRRILRPSGMVALTTRGRDFIEFLAAQRALPEPPSWLPAAFSDAERCLGAFDAGAFVHDSYAGGGTLDASFWGETCIPRAYVENQWYKVFQLVDYIEDRSQCEQNVIVARCRK